MEPINRDSPIIHSLVRLYNARLSPDNAVRKDAEQRLYRMQAEDVSGLTVATLLLLKEHPEEEIRQQSAFHMKQMLKESNGAVADSALPYWSILPDEIKQVVKTQLLSALETTTENSKFVRAAVCSAVVLLATNTSTIEGWPELQSRVFALLGSDHVGCQVSGLQLLNGLTSQLPGAVKENIGIIHDVCGKLLYADSTVVRAECARLLAAVVESEKRRVWKHLVDCVPALLAALESSIHEPEDEIAAKFLISLLDIAEADAGFFASHFNPLADLIFTVARNESVSDRIRQLDVELALTIAEAKPKMCKKANGFIDKLIILLMEFLLDLEDDPDWGQKDAINLHAEDDVSDLDDTSNYEVAEAGLDRLAAFIGGEIVLQKIQNIVIQYLQDASGDWRKKHAAMIAIAQTVEHIPEEEENATDRYLEQVVPLCLAQLKDGHPRVRYAACQAIGQAATDTQPLMQELYTSTVLPALIQSLDDSFQRVQSHAARAITNFAEAVSAEDLEPYLPILVDKLLQRVSLTNGTPKPLLSSCVTALAVVAGAADKSFVPYHTSVIPAMKEIVRTCTGPSDRTCSERALECITLIALAIGSEAFSPNTSECMEALLHLWCTAADRALHRPTTATEDDGDKGEGPSETITDSLCRMCRVLEGQFTPYLPLVLPRIFNFLAQTPHDVTLEDLAGLKQDVCLVSLADGKTMGMKTQITLEMEQMTTLLCTFIMTLGQNCKEYIAHIMEAVLPLLDLHFCEKIVQNSLNVIGETLRVARLLADKEPDPSYYLTTIARWLSTALEKTFAALEDEQTMIDNASEIPRGIAVMIKSAGPSLLQAEHVGAIGMRALKLLEGSCTRDGGEYELNDDADEDDVEEAEGERRYELDLAASVADIFSALIEHYGLLFCQTLGEACVQFAQKCLKVSGEQKVSTTIGLYVIVGLVELGDQAGELWMPFLPTLLEAVHSADPLLRQPAAHGLKLAAKTTNSLPADSVVAIGLATLRALDNAKKLPSPASDHDQASTENVVSAIGALAIYQAHVLAACGDPQLSPAHIVRLWLSHLPLKTDEREGQMVHETLVKLVMEGNELVIGQNMSHMPAILVILADIYKKSHSTTNVDAMILNIVRNTLPNYGGPDQLVHEIQNQRAHNPLTREQMKALEKLFCDAMA